MTRQLTIVAKIGVNPGQVDLVKSEPARLIEPILHEAGCVQYDLHQDDSDQAVFLFYERWENREL